MNNEKPQHPKRWLREGLIWAAFMYPIITFLLPLVMGDEITLKSALLPIPVWLLAGLGYGYTTRRIFARIREKK